MADTDRTIAAATETHRRRVLEHLSQQAAATQTPSAYRIERAMSAANELRTQLADDIGGDAELLLDLLDGQTNVLDIVRVLLRASLEAEAYAEATANRIKQLQERKARFERRQFTARATAFAMLEELDVPRLDDAEFTVSKSKPGKPPLVIVNADALPDRLCRIKREPDKPAIRAELEQGVVLDGAVLGNAAPVWSVRVK